MAIEKAFGFRCDYCGTVVDTVQADSKKDAICYKKKNPGKAVFYQDGTCFCNVECQQGWTEKWYKDLGRPLREFELRELQRWRGKQND